jgi:hypothetical protein
MEWIVLFAVSWLLFFSLKGWKKLGTNIWCGLAAVAAQLFVDYTSIHKGLYEIRDPVVPILGSSAFFCLGPVFVIAVLLSAYHPVKRWLASINVFVLSSIFSAQEYLLMERKVLVYHNWHFTESIFMNLVIIISLSWISVFILGRGGLRN